MTSSRIHLPSLHDALPILQEQWTLPLVLPFESFVLASVPVLAFVVWRMRSRERARAIFSVPQNRLLVVWFGATLDRKSTRLNSSHLVISYAVFCLNKKKKY